MPWNSDPAMQSLRLAYNAAVAAHAGCARALTDAALRGEQPTPAMVEAAANAKARLTATREKLHAAMALAMAPGGTASKPPTD
jgi:lysozyme family protein